MKTLSTWNPNDSMIVKNFFENRLKSNSENYKVLGYGSKKSQAIRFKVATEIGNIQGKSILDYGCGLGDFIEYLDKRRIKIRYTGYDISEKLIERARQLHPNHLFEIRDAMEELPSQKFSYVFAIGLNIKITDNVGFIKELIKRMFQIAKEGVCVSLLSCHSAHFDSESFYYDPALLLDWCLREISSRCILRHDYLPHDFTLYIYRTHSRSGGK